MVIANITCGILRIACNSVLLYMKAELCNYNSLFIRVRLLRIRQNSISSAYKEMFGNSAVLVIL